MLLKSSGSDSLSFSLFSGVLVGVWLFKSLFSGVQVGEKFQAYNQSTSFNHKSLFHLYCDGFPVIMIYWKDVATFVCF